MTRRIIILAVSVAASCATPVMVLPGGRSTEERAETLLEEDETRHHGKTAELVPEAPEVRAVGANLDYRAALRGEDDSARADALDRAKEGLAETSDQPLARRLVIDDLIRRQDWEGALAEIDKALASRPDPRGLYAQRLGVLERLGRPEAIEAQYDEMLGRFPGDARNITASAVRWYLSEGRADDAESFLRDRLDSEGAGDDMRMALVRFLAGQRGAETALAELDRIIAAGPEDPARFRSTRARIRFETGARAEAISETRAVLEDAEPSDATDRIRVALARMLERTGDRVGARSGRDSARERSRAGRGAQAARRLADRE